MEKAALMAKEALLRKAGAPSPDPEVAQLEAEILAFGQANRDRAASACGAVQNNSDVWYTSYLPNPLLPNYPVAVNIQCHAARHQEIIL